MLFGQSRPEALNDKVDRDQEDEIADEGKQDPDSMEKNKIQTKENKINPFMEACGICWRWRVQFV